VGPKVGLEDSGKKRLLPLDLDSSENRKERDHFPDIDTDERIILWRLDLLLSSDSVKSDRFWATAR
jgi:hypothetical protein